MSFKIYVIHLDKHPSKKEEMIKQLSFFKDIEYEFIEGCDGVTINKEYMLKNDLFVNQFFRNPYCYNSITLGEIGCTLSHIKVWQKADIDNNDYSIILEDDCVINHDFISIINQLIYDKNVIDSDFIYLGRKIFDKEETLVSQHNFFKLVIPNFSYWTIGYMLTKRGIKQLIKAKLKKNIIPIDEFLPICYKKNDINYENDISLTALAIVPEIIKPKINAFFESETESSPYYQYNYLDNFYKNRITLVSVASDKLDGYYRFLESTKIYGFPCTILGMNEPWNGNDMRVGTGGGQKVNLLKNFLSKYADDDTRLILFSDCYDAVISDNPDNILKKFENNFKCDILFSCEPILWPDKSIEKYFPEVNTPYRFLNSGGFIGSIKHIKLLINTEITDDFDDQLYYQKIYLESKRKHSNSLRIELDNNCIIFQTLSAHLDSINIDFDKSKIRNDITKTYPSLVHGNGGIDSKIFLSNLTNYINQKYRPCYGYKDTHSDIKKFDNFNNNNQYPKILFYLPVYNTNNINNLNNILDLTYPLKICKLLIVNVDNIDDELFRIKIEILQKSISIEYINLKKNNLSQRDFLIKSINHEYHYMFILNLDHKITDPNLLKYLICSNLEIVSPMITSKNNPLFSNFWGDIDQNGYYRRSFNYLNIIRREELGFWCVPFISGSILISEQKYSELNELLNKNEMLEDIFDFDMYLSRIIREHYNFMYVSNYYNFAYILDNDSK